MIYTLGLNKEQLDNIQIIIGEAKKQGITKWIRWIFLQEEKEISIDVAKRNNRRMLFMIIRF